MNKNISSPDVSCLTAFYNAIIRAWVLTAVALADNERNPSHIMPSRDALEALVEEFIKKYDVGYILRDASPADTLPNKKRKMVDYDRLRASQCVRSDWYSPYPRFDDRQFERTFHIKRSMVESILSKLVETDSFWVQSIDCCGRESIDPIVKFLGAQKLICFGVSFSAFKNYFQMGESTARLCLRKLTKGIVLCSSISDYYLRTPSKSDARKIVALHKKVYGIDGCMGCLDVTKIHWGACPVAWKGQFEGKEGFPTIGLEAVSDYNLWIWHNAFGFPGSLNDINVWDRSPLLESMMDGSHDAIDFSFDIDGQQFDQLYYLVDGIYPSLSWFLATVNDPTTALDCFYAPKQEGWRKSIERAFGVLKKKFLSIGTKSVLYHREDMFYLVTATILMHNMMVEVRVDNNKDETENFYDVGDVNINDSCLEEEESVGSDDSAESNLSTAVGNYDLSHVRDSRLKYAIIQRRWKTLYSEETSLRLQDAVKKYIFKKHFGDDGTLNTTEFADDYDPLFF